MTESPMADSPLLTKSEAARILRVSSVTVHRMIREARLGSVRVGARVFTTRRFIDDFLERNRKGPVVA